MKIFIFSTLIMIFTYSKPYNQPDPCIDVQVENQIDVYKNTHGWKEWYKRHLQR